jgi:hypothetical protein
VTATVADDRAERERYIEQRLAEERARLEKAFNERLATERAAMARDFEQRLAAERAAMQKSADERIAAAERSANARVANIQTQLRREYLIRLREANELALRGRLNDANAMYIRLLDTAEMPREILAEAAVGLYRTGAYRSAANAFQMLGTFARGEEDLRYYNAVALYETGKYDEARRELACALPFIQVTDDVTRYQNKIERSDSRQAVR